MSLDDTEAIYLLFYYCTQTEVIYLMDVIRSNFFNSILYQFGHKSYFLEHKQCLHHFKECQGPMKREYLFYLQTIHYAVKLQIVPAFFFQNFLISVLK